MVTLFNTLTNDYKKNNSWEQMARPKELLGGGGMAATAEMVDLFPMADGKKPGESVFEYDELKFYKNRDPRFYRTFAFNGVVWPYKMDNGYTLWNYQWYKDEDSLKVGNLVILLNIQGMSILVYLCVNVQILRHNGIMQINSI